MLSVVVSTSGGLLAAMLLPSCKPSPEARKDATLADPPRSDPRDAEVVLADAAVLTDATAVEGGASYVPFAGDAGAASCKLLYGPQEQPFRGTAALAQDGARLAIVANDSGKPRGFSVPLPPASVVVAPTRVLSFEAMSYPPCENAGKTVYCPGRGGAIRKLTGSSEKEVAKGRTGTRVAAAPLGDTHSVVAYLIERTTSEGTQLQAFAVLDDGEPVRLSEEGSGATQLALVPVGEKAVALYLDARTAMTPVHAREVSQKDGKLVLGPDAVLTVGGPAERGVTVVGGRMKDAIFALLPMPQDVTTFGMTTLPVGSPPKDDVKPIVSPYRNGLDPAPLAATRSDLDRVYVARVVPEGPERFSPRALELGHLKVDGAFVSHGLVARGAAITDVSILLDTYRTVWVLYGDAAHTWLSRYMCP